jgi:hypothetical protein
MLQYSSPTILLHDFASLPDQGGQLSEALPVLIFPSLDLDRHVFHFGRREHAFSVMYATSLDIFESQRFDNLQCPRKQGFGVQRRVLTSRINGSEITWPSFWITNLELSVLLLLGNSDKGIEG